MKKKCIEALALIVCLISCSPAETESIQPEETLYPVQFTLQLNTEILPFTQTKSMPPLSIPEPGTKNSEESGALYQQIEYIVYRKDAEGNRTFIKNQSLTQENSNGDFGIIYDKLPSGTFQIAFITHSSPTPALANETLTFSEISDTFWCTSEYEISSTSNTNETPTLSRIIGKIEFVSTDVIPQEMSRFTLQIQPYLLNLDIFSGKGLASEESHTIQKEPTPEEIGQTGQHSFYSFVPLEGTGLNLTLTAGNAAGETIRQRTINDVMPLANQTLRYTGLLYTAPKDEDSFELSVENDGNWGATTDVPLPDFPE